MPTLGTSILLVAVGAILRYAVTASTSAVSLPTIGLILMLAGIVGAVIALLYMFAASGRRARYPGEPVDPYREPPAV
jgi:heme/copper-type cytochrome/quinol oxidase subunit 2